MLLQESHKHERDKLELDASAKIKTNPKYFFSYAKLFYQTKPKVGPLLDPSTNKLTSDSQEMANILQSQYCSILAPPKTEYNFPNLNTPDETSILADIIFTEEDIIREIDTIPANSAPVADGLPAIFFEMCKLPLSKPLKII